MGELVKGVVVSSRMLLVGFIFWMYWVIIKVLSFIVEGFLELILQCLMCFLLFRFFFFLALMVVKIFLVLCVLFIIIILSFMWLILVCVFICDMLISFLILFLRCLQVLLAVLFVVRWFFWLRMDISFLKKFSFCILFSFICLKF